jgi:integrase
MNSGEAPNAIEVEAGSEEFERVAQRKGSPQRVRQIFSEFYREHYGEDLPFASTRKYALEWLATRQAESSPATHRRYGDAVEKFLSFLGAAADNGLEEISRSQVAAFRDARVQQSATLTANTDLKIIRAVFRSARREGYLFQDPAEGVKTVKNREVFERRPFSIDELRAVLGVADPEWQSLIKFGLYTGQRLGDLARLTWSQIYLERDEIRLTTRKTDKQLLIPIALPLRESTFAGPYAPPAPRLCGRLHILHCAPCGSRE